MGSVQVIPVLKINFSPPTAESRIRKNVDLDLFYLLLSFTDAPTPPSIQNVQGVFFLLDCPKSARPLGNSDTWNFFEGIYM